MPCEGFLSILRIFGTTLFGVSLLTGMILSYVIGYQFIHTDDYYLSFGPYGAFLALHVLIQNLFAFLEHRKMKKYVTIPVNLNRTVALCIAAYQEDPDYLRKCLRSVKRLTYPGIKVVMVIDGNSEDDLYMMDIFSEVMGRDQSATYIWKNNYHVKGPGETDESHKESSQHVTQLVLSNKSICIMQKWGGKREVMYTAFRALGRSVDYVQVCDSDTMLDPAATVEMVKVLEVDHKVGGVGGDVKILNKYDSWVSFLKRACQSYFGCVQCISGPLGMYRNSLLHEFVEDWYNQEFMGSQCSFGDDRHLTNRVLSLGYATKYTARSKCLTETPKEYLRWLNQQTRWTVITGFFPFFLIATVIRFFYRGNVWNILLLLLTIKLVALIKSSFAICLRGNIVMVFMSFYSVLYMSSLLPAKIFAIVTINKAGWGTSGRKKIVANFVGLIPVSVWSKILLGGLIFTIYEEVRKPFPESKKKALVIALSIYACYWVVFLMLYAVFVKRCGRWKKKEQYDMMLDV
uniref:Hyaluronan synthase 2 n=1 Tax=Bos indicus x Bos taurus TaxID=30522 RepID=A0A4W2EB18_BOBOX